MKKTLKFDLHKMKVIVQTIYLGIVLHSQVEVDIPALCVGKNKFKLCLKIAVVTTKTTRDVKKVTICL